MKNNILFILCFLFLGIIIYPDRCRAMGGRIKSWFLRLLSNLLNV